MAGHPRAMRSSSGAIALGLLTVALIAGQFLGSGSARAREAAGRAHFGSRPRWVGTWKGQIGLGEPSVAINPTDPDNIILGTNDYNYVNGWGLGIFTSWDAGATWTKVGLVDIKGAARQKDATGADPAVTFTKTGVAYYAGLAIGTKRGGIFVMRSDDKGRTWSRPKMIVTNRTVDQGRCYGSDKEYIAADPNDPRSIYVAYTRARRDDCNNKDLQYPYADGSPIALISTHDGGKTWSRPMQVSRNRNDAALGAMPAVGPHHVLYVAAVQETPQHIECPDSRSLLWGPPHSEAIVIATSRDEGRHWSYRHIIPFCGFDYFTGVAEAHDLGTANSMPTLTVDPSTGVAYVAWSNVAAPDSTIHVASSDDEGRSWTLESLVYDDARGAELPWLVARDGVLRLVYKSVDAASQSLAYYRESVDGGKTWTAPTVLDRGASCDGCPATDTADHGHAGDYWNLDARCGTIAAVWGAYSDRPGIPNVMSRTGSYATRERC